MRILFVCLGNICRSSAAQGVLERMAENQHVSIVADSAGTYGGHAGQLPDSRMRAHAAKRGYVLDHRSRKVKTSDFSNFDIIVAMDNNNFYDLKALAPSPEDEKKLRLFASYLTNHQDSYVPDPYYEGADGFELVLDLLEDGCDSILKRVKTNRPL